MKTRSDKISDNHILQRNVDQLTETVQQHHEEQMEMKEALLGMIQANTQMVQLVQNSLGLLENVIQQNQESSEALAERVKQIKEETSGFISQQASVNQQLFSHVEGQMMTNTEMQGHLHNHAASIQELLIHEHHQLLPEDCGDLLNRGVLSNGVYTIYVNGNRSQPRQVYCDMEHADGGWMVIQRRMDGSEDFLRTWKEYADGFGNLTGEFWLGNDLIANLTQQPYVLRIDFCDFDGACRWAQYRDFVMAPADKKYRITARDFTGNAGDSLIGWHNSVPFSTVDHDNDFSDMNCARRFSGAWWYNMCHVSNLNGKYHEDGRCRMGEGINWQTWRGYYRSLMSTEMKIRPLTFHVHF